MMFFGFRFAFPAFFSTVDSMTALPNFGRGFLRANCLVLLVLIFLARCSHAADTNSDALRMVQERLLNAELTIEKNRQEAAAAAASNAVAMDDRLKALDRALASERAAQVAAAEHSNRMILIASGAVAAVGFLALVFGAFMQWAAVNRLAAAAAGLSAIHSQPALGMGETQLLPTRSVEQSNARFLALIDQLERRLRELESSSHPAAATLGESVEANGGSHENESPAAAEGKTGVSGVLLNKSQTLMKLDKPEAALECLDELLAQDPHNAQALVKRGAALERLQRFDEAIQCYDSAIAQDDSMTMAYLSKGGVFNRLERYAEALACYEQALKKSDKTTRAQTQSAEPN
jgi:tetratricopeptide (TPR) repeat protein